MQDLLSARHELSQQLVQDLEAYREQVKAAAASERDYRRALAVRMNGIHAAGVAWSATGDLARGQSDVADLRFKRDCDAGLLDACREAINVRKKLLGYVQSDIEREWRS